ncbi:FAD linked oxidase domain protein [Catenulispora acidiphila DSM 44928]|uniref:FAD linked oxidase domain protein n=1 Tax=Catenulispora acidiphila (strain DSM 44928 / JCM 14897 / NBRC 102108 / NRRL B-24433 / ID139908) TaxID=479433 RepID=C7Q5W0_CATAD|nr:FAD-binding oxidoreductase [Catenulispora acidiphila]ACU70057.1 FAD linked oxidase domain protein [Catenulispora acidiphila DSM 44928]
MTATTTLEILSRDFSGDIIEPGHAEYAAASGVVLAAGAPAVILRPSSVGGVQAAVRHAAASGLPLAVRGGGHSFGGFGTNDGGVVIDLSRLCGVEVVAGGWNVVRVGGGATWGQVTAALKPHRLALSSGDTKGVGVGGLTLGGGIGWKVRKYGLALDSLVRVEIVTADGHVVTADEDENADLFWAVRGGGGNFGIVTAFEFAGHPTTDVFHGKISFPGAEAATVIPAWAEYMRTAPEALTTIAVFANPFAGPGAPVEILVTFDGDATDEADAAIDPLRRLGTLIDDDITLKPYGDVLEEAPPLPPALRFHTRNAFVERAGVDAALRIMTEAGAAPGAPFLTARSLGGALARVPDDATAFAHRRAELMIGTALVGPEPVIEAAIPALDALWERLTPHVNGTYPNFNTTATDQEIAAAYPTDTYKRLAAVKRHYDPANLFTANYNVLPL